MLSFISNISSKRLSPPSTFQAITSHSSVTHLRITRCVSMLPLLILQDLLLETSTGTLNITGSTLTLERATTASRFFQSQATINTPTFSQSPRQKCYSQSSGTFSWDGRRANLAYHLITSPLTAYYSCGYLKTDLQKQAGVFFYYANLYLLHALIL